MTDTLKPSEYFTGELFPHQSYAVVRMLKSRAIVNGDATGLGKTIEFLCAYCYLKEYSGLRAIIVTPTSSALQWEEEVLKFSKNLTVSTVLSDTSFLKSRGFSSRREALESFINTDTDILIIPYSALVIEARALYRAFREINFKFAICLDEVTYLKNNKAMRSQVIEPLVKMAQYRYGLSATLMKNTLYDIYNIYCLLGLRLYGSRKAFEKKFINLKKINVGKLKLGKIISYRDLKALRKLINPYYFGRLKSEVGSLPSLILKKHIFPMSPKQVSLIDRLHRMCDSLEDGEINYGVLYFQLQMAALAPHLLEVEGLSNNTKQADSSKYKALEEILRTEIDEKCVVFTRYVSVLKDVVAYLRKKHYEVYEIHGEKSAVEKNEQKKRFLEAKGSAILFLTEAGEESLNLQVAMHLIMMEAPRSFGSFTQLIGRIQRLSANFSTMIVHLFINSQIDVKTYKRLQFQQSAFNKVFVAGKTPDIPEIKISTKELVREISHNL